MGASRTLLRVGLAATVALRLVPALAQTGVVNPGAIGGETRRALERQGQPANPAPVERPLVDELNNRPKLKLNIPEGRKFVLKRIKFDPSRFLSAGELDKIAKFYLGRPIGLRDLQEMASAINTLYDHKGIATASALVKPQRIHDGVLHISLVEAKVGKVAVKGNSYTRESFVRERVPSLAPGETLDPHRLDSDLAYFNRVNDAQLKAALRPGDSFGLSNVDLVLEEPKQTDLRVFADNQGIDSTSPYEVGAYFRQMGLLGIQDRLTGFGTFSRGSLNGNVSYDMPFDASGGRVGATYGQSEIKIVQGPTDGLNTRGRSETWALNGSQPVYVTGDWLVVADSALSDTLSRTGDSGVQITDDTTYKATGGLAISRLGPGYQAAFTQRIGGATNEDIAMDWRRFLIYTGSFIGQVALKAPFSLAVNAAWQYTPENLLPSSQLFQIGGPTTVRGYQANLLSGDKGYYADLELHRGIDEILQGLDGFAFLDRGHVATVGFQDGLVSTGLGASWTWNQTLTLEVTGAVPLEHVNAEHRDYRLYGRVSWHVF